MGKETKFLSYVKLTAREISRQFRKKSHAMNYDVAKDYDVIMNIITPASRVSFDFLG